MTTHIACVNMDINSINVTRNRASAKGLYDEQVIKQFAVPDVRLTLYIYRGQSIVP
jgi:hypothetical protein